MSLHVPATHRYVVETTHHQHGPGSEHMDRWTAQVERDDRKAWFGTAGTEADAVAAAFGMEQR